MASLIGRRFGRLKVLEKVSTTGRARLLCRCDCGRQTVVWGSNLKNGFTQSCGCLYQETNTIWTDDRIELLKKLRSDGLSNSQIAAGLGLTYSAVSGEVHRAWSAETTTEENSTFT